MAPGVAKSFVKELYKVISIKYPECNRELTEEEKKNGLLNNAGIKDKLKKVREFNRLILHKLDRVKEILITRYCKKLDENEVDEIISSTLELVEDATHQAMEAVVHNLNSMHSRAGAQVPFSSLNFGTDTSQEGRMVSKYLLYATDEGLGNGETPIFPISIFKLKSGVSFNPEDKNYDLFKLACKVSAKRLFPNFSNLDVPFNAQYYKEGHPETEAAYMGCASGDSEITFRIFNHEVHTHFSDVWNELTEHFPVKKYGVSEYIEPTGMTILDDSSEHRFVECKKLIRNPNKHNWVWLTLLESDGVVTKLTLTEDHPLMVVGKGRVFTRDIEVGDYLVEGKTLNHAKIIDKHNLTEDEENNNIVSLDYSFDVETETDKFTLNGIISHNCRTRVMANAYDPTKEIVNGRGNLSFTTINLPRLGIKAGGDIKVFFELLDNMLELVHHQLLARFEVQCRKHPRNYPFLMGQGVWINSDELSPDDDMREILRHGTLTVGFIGLAECLVALTGKHHGESEESQKLGLKIIGHMREMTDLWSKQERMNYSVIATPAEGIAGRFTEIDKRKFGVIPGVTDRDYYTNSMHVPVYYNISAFKKINIEAPYHALCNGGHITYIELDGDPLKNLDGFEKVVRYMHDAGIGYGAINHPLDSDPICGYQGIIDDVCPRCGRREGEPMTEEMWRKIKGYASAPNAGNCGTCGDPNEEADRIPNKLDFIEEYKD